MKNNQIKIATQDVSNEEGILSYHVIILEYSEPSQNEQQILHVYRTAYPKGYKYYDSQFKHYNLIFN